MRKSVACAIPCSPSDGRGRSVWKNRNQYSPLLTDRENDINKGLIMLR